MMYRFFVEDEEDVDDVESSVPEDVYEQDLVTLRVTFTRENLTEGTKVAPVYAPKFPKAFYENWWLILSDKFVETKISKVEGKAPKTKEVAIHAIDKVSDKSRTVKFDLKFMAPQAAGSYDLELRLVCDSYMGLDRTIPITLVVKPASELPEYKAHDEDIALDNEPTLFEQMMAANADEDSSDDEKEPAHENDRDVKLNSKSVIYEEDEDDD
jgi:translocation protein SEC63